MRVVEKGGAADKAGVQVGDIVTSFNGKPVERANDLPRLVGETKPDTTVPMQVLRMGKTLTLNVKVGEWVMDKKPGAKPVEEQKPEAVSKANALGVKVIDLNEAQKRQLGVSSGVLVEAVRNGARYAGRLEVTEVCDGATTIIPAARIAEIKLLTRTGQLDDGTMHPLVPGWGDDAVFVSVDCDAFVDTGIYRELDAAGPVATVAAKGVPYPSLFGGLGIFDPGISMNARASAPVIGLGGTRAPSGAISAGPARRNSRWYCRWRCC